MKCWRTENETQSVLLLLRIFVSFIHYSALTLLKSELVFIKLHASYKEKLIYLAHANTSVILILYY